ncbi:MAG: hypothetical protein K2X47_19015, partial [Bdellovibrionales bacterium]|nr:hypothetical protein [Bdellovibrionales bacterium]
MFPMVHALLAGASLVFFLSEPTWMHFLLLITLVYFFPVTAFRIHNYFFPLREGITDISKPVYSGWWGSHQFQYLFISVPFLETVLHFVPGLYSAWLRAWGSRIGRNVYWTPRVEVMDRSLLEVGSGVVIGDMVIFCAHV